jgi:hypothetical protein
MQATKANGQFEKKIQKNGRGRTSRMEDRPSESFSNYKRLMTGFENVVL